jgi:heptosyltransferase-2
MTEPARSPRQTPPALAAPSSILIRTPNWLGDLLVGTAFVSAVLQRFPGIPVELVVRRGFEVLPLPRRGEVIPYDRRAEGPGAFGRRLRGRGHSHLFVLPPSFSSAWMAFRSGIPWRIGYRGALRGWLLRPALAHRHPPRSVHLAQEYLDLLRPWLETTPEAFPASLSLPPGWTDEHRPAELPADGATVVLAPGAEYGPAKQWPIPHYARTAAALLRAGLRVVVVGLDKDRALAGEMLAGHPAGLNLCGRTDLRGLTAVIAGAALLISNDSGAMHLGAALGRPQIALFGSTNPRWTAPLNSRAELLYRNEPCSPCYARTCPLGHLRCLVGLAPEEVLERAWRLLERPPPAGAPAPAQSADSARAGGRENR